MNDLVAENPDELAIWVSCDTCMTAWPICPLPAPIEEFVAAGRSNAKCPVCGERTRLAAQAEGRLRDPVKRVRS